MLYRFFFKSKVGMLTLVAVLLATIVVCIKLGSDSDRIESRKRAQEAHQIVFEACGPEASRRFERTFDGRDGRTKREQAERWAADCAGKP